MTATRLYSMRAAARKLRVTRYRLAHLLTVAGVTPRPVEGSACLTLDEVQFLALRAAHRTTPYRRAGRPLVPRPADGATDVADCG